MTKLFTFLAFVFLSFIAKSQDAIRITDPIPQQKAILVIPGITAEQLQSLKTEFIKYSEITQAVYVYKDHNCLLVNITTSNTIKFYSDLIKIIQGATGLTEKDMAIKTSAAYDTILPSSVSAVDAENETSTNFIVK